MNPESHRVTAVRGKAKSLALVALAYVVAVGVGAVWLTLGPDTNRLWLDLSLIHI